MRILFLTHQYFPHHVGGTEVYLRGLVRRIRAAGHDTLVISCRESGKNDSMVRAEEIVHEDGRVIELHFNLGAMADVPRAEYDNPAVGREVRRIVASYRPDVAHALHAMKLSAAALEACLDAEVPLLVTPTDYWYLCPRGTLVDLAGEACSGPDWPQKCVSCVRALHGYPGPGDVRSLVTLSRRPLHLRRVLLRAARIIAFSREQRQAFIDNGYPPERITILPHGLETSDLLSAVPRTQERRPLRQLGVVGSVVPHKGPHIVLEALQLATELNLECRIHGALRGDAYSATVRMLAQQDSRVRLMGEFAPEQTGAVLGALDLLAVPALWPENEPLLVKAALHLGVPILATPHGSVGDLVGRHGGWLTGGDSPADWARALRQFSSHGVPPVVPTPMKSLDVNAREWLEIYIAEARQTRPHGKANSCAA